jgi:asparagine synthase (glutamine-hydrolysing)
MCGIVGAWQTGRDLRALVASASGWLRHRGPDDAGVWAEEAAGIAFGHTRLAVLDLSAAGHQPMTSSCGRYTLVYNGEIYNHLELRARLPAQPWRGHSDSETLLACCSAWGFERTLRAAVGMFALAVFDSAERVLYLARDRLGEKPLYYGYVGGGFAFASELKALRHMPGFPAALDRSALSSYLQLGYVPGPKSIYAAIDKLPAGCWLRLSAAELAAGHDPQPSSYWSALEVAQAGERDPLDVGEGEAVDGLERVLGDAVAGQLISDVPLGLFLSGGIDSTTIAALMRVRCSGAVRTFSIGFEEDEYDESREARRIAAHLGTEHTELVARAADLLPFVEALPRIYDEPFADASQLPTCLLASLARRSVTVALSGDGGDELFGGYNRYFLAARNWPRIRRLPRILRRGAAAAVHAVPADAWQSAADLYRACVPARRQLRNPGEKLVKIADALASEHETALYHSLIGGSPLEVALPADESAQADLPPLHPAASLPLRMMLSDAVSYLPDDVLVKVDRASMAVGLETRVPLLDHRVFEYAWRLPLRMKLRGGTGKWVLRRLLDRYVPSSLVERPKMGFAVPLNSWLRGPLRAWAQGLLDEARLRREGFLRAQAVQSLWREHLSGRRRWEGPLWRVLMFQAWLATEGRGLRAGEPCEVGAR